MSIDLLENCDPCYRACLSELPASISINGRLAANTNYILKVTDKFGNRYSTAAKQLKNCEVAISGPWPPYHFLPGKLRTVAGNS